MSKILLAHTDRDMRTSIAVSLERLGYNVTTAENGQDVLTKLEEAWPGLVVMGNDMPDMTGLEVLGLMQLTVAHHGKPVIILDGPQEKVRSLGGIWADTHEPKAMYATIEQALATVR